MRLFQKNKPSESQGVSSLAITDLQERMDKLERDLRDLRTDWNATYEKFHALTMRMAKRIKREEEKSDPENGSESTKSGKGSPNPLAQQLLRRGRF